MALPVPGGTIAESGASTTLAAEKAGGEAAVYWSWKVEKKPVDKLLGDMS